MAVKSSKVVNIGGLLQEYEQLKAREKSIKSRKDALAKMIKEYATKNGVKDSNGSYYAEDNDFIFGSQARKSVKLKEDEAKEFFRSRGLYEEVIDTVEVLNEDKIEQLVTDEKITVEDIEALTDVKVQFAIDVRVKETEQTPEEMPEIQVQNSNKKRRLIKKK